MCLSLITDMLGPFMGAMENLSFDSLGKMFSDFTFPLDEIKDQISGIQEQIVSAVSFDIPQIILRLIIFVTVGGLWLLQTLSVCVCVSVPLLRLISWLLRVRL